MRRFYEPVIVPEDDEVLCTNDFECECAACLEWRAEEAELARAWQAYYERLESERGGEE